MVKKKENKKKCFYCEDGIDLDEDQYILLGTYDGELVRDESYFHLYCFKKWFSIKVNEKAKNIIKGLQTSAMDLFGDIKGVIGEGGVGLNQFESLIDFDLEGDTGKNGKRSKRKKKM